MDALLPVAMACREALAVIKGQAADAPSPPRIAGHSRALAETLHLVRAAAPQPDPILFLGESGTGKDLFARETHVVSGREGDFVAVNCAAISETLLESELFGHKKGSFTNATSNRAGAFVAAHKGTLLLDEIAEMPQRLQAALLRATEQGVVRPVGADADVPVDVRLVSATNADLEALVRAGRFREDLFMRISTFPIRVPPLRERPGDIGDIARMIARERGIALTECAIRYLETLDLPGNVRGLRNLLIRALVIRKNPVTAEKLQAQVAYDGRVAPRALPATLHEAIERVRAQMIGDALAAAAGRVAEAAEKLGISPQALHKHLKSHPDINPGGSRINPG